MVDAPTGGTEGSLWTAILGLLLLIVVLCAICLPLAASRGPVAYGIMLPTMVVAVVSQRWLRRLSRKWR